MKAILCLLALCFTGSSLAEPVLKPFSAHYVGSWKGINVATSDISLQPAEGANHYTYVWKLEARGIFRMAYAPVTQTAWLSVENQHARAHRYLGEEGDASVSLNFDWDKKRITGLSEKKPIDIAIENDAFDVNTIQVEVMLDLMHGSMPKTFQIIDKDQLKAFNYTMDGPARIRTEVGELDTLVVTSSRGGTSRILRMWFAPSLGYMPIQAERSTNGKIEFAIRIKSYTH